MSSFHEKFGSLLLSASGFLAWNAWQWFFSTYKGLYVSDFSGYSNQEIWQYTGKLQLCCHTTVVLMIILGCKLVPQGSELKGKTGGMMVRKSIQTLLSMFTDPINYTAMDNLYNAMTFTYKKDQSVQQEANMFFIFFSFSLVISYLTDIFWKRASKGQLTSMIGDQIINSTHNNLSWYNAISMMNTIFLLLKVYFPVTIINIWLEDITLLFVFSVLIGGINYRVVGDNIQHEMGLTVKMLYVCVLTFLATTFRSLIIKTLMFFCGGMIPPVIFLSSALLLTLTTCLFSLSLKKYIAKYAHDGNNGDLHDTFGEVLEAYDKYLFGWLVSQFWNKFILSAFDQYLQTDNEKLAYCLIVTLLVSMYGTFIFKVKVNQTLNAYRKAIKNQVGKGMAKSVKSDGSHEEFGKVFARLLTNNNKGDFKKE